MTPLYKFISIMLSYLAMKRQLLSIFLFLSLPLSALDLPKQFYIQYQTLTNGSLFHVMKKNGKPMAKVEREKLQQREQFFLRTLEGKLIAFADLKKSGSMIVATIKEPNGKKIGWFSATIYNLYPTEFKLFGTANHLLAIGRMNLIGSRFTLADPDNAHREYVTYYRPRFKLHTDTWHVEITKEDIIDPAILVIVGAFQTSLNLGLEGY